MEMPEIVGDTWLNTRPLKTSDLRGKVVLVDFWTYSCVNCIRTLPYLRGWWDRYSSKKFVLLGVHAPEFDFEKDPDNVRKFMEEKGVNWPVVLDNRFFNWHNFANHYWPAKYLADQHGNIVYTHFGEGDYSETEAKIRQLLKEDRDNQPLPAPAPHETGLECFRATPETYCGYIRGEIQNAGSYSRDTVAEYHAPPALNRDTISLDGRWLGKGQYVESKAAGSSLKLEFKATEVNLVMSQADGPARALITLNGKVPEPDELGTDCDRAGIVTPGEPRMYNLLESGHPMEGTLEVLADEGSLRAYAFTFSGCVEAQKVEPEGT